MEIFTQESLEVNSNLIARFQKSRNSTILIFIHGENGSAHVVASQLATIRPEKRMVAEDSFSFFHVEVRKGSS